jgi:hypothetical protein
MTIISEIDPNCTCTESTGLRVHNCRYRILRDSLLDQAADFADSQLLGQQGTKVWSRLFNSEIVRLLARAEDGGGNNGYRGIEMKNPNLARGCRQR